MMTRTSRRVDFKFNPGFKADDDLERDFIVRKRELRSVLGTLERNARRSRIEHILIVGARGTGKTTLVRRTAAEIRRNEQLAAAWHPVVFGEESYSITSPGEFWLECFYQIQSELETPHLERRFLELRSISNDEQLFIDAHQAVLDEAQRLGRRLVLIVENFGELISQMGRADASIFNQSLAKSNDVMLVASSTSKIECESFEDGGHFTQIAIGPLSARDCRILWLRVSGQRLKIRQVRPIQILTGGNPRLIRILAEFAANSVYFELVEKLEILIDQYTDYFKGQLDNLPTGERKVFVSLLDLWDPALTREVAESARMETRQTGAYLDRLHGRGIVTKEGSRWQASERLINIYYLMRRHGRPSNRVKALVRFMTIYYRPDELEVRIQELAQEACDLNPAQRGDYYHMVSALIREFTPGMRRRVVSQLPNAFFKDPNLPPPLAELQMLLADSERTVEHDPLGDIIRHLDSGDWQRAEDILLDLQEKQPTSALTLLSSAVFAFRQGRDSEAETALRAILADDPDDDAAAMLLCSLLLRTDRANDALALAKRLTELDDSSAYYWLLRGECALELGDLDEASAALGKAHRQEPSREEVLARLGVLEGERGNLTEARRWFDLATQGDQPDLASFLSYSDFLVGHELHVEAEKLLRRAADVHPDAGIVFFRLALLRVRDGARQEAKLLFERCLELDPEQPYALGAYADLLFDLGHVSAAKDAWRRALEHEQDSADLWLSYAVFLDAAGQAQEAEQGIRRSIELDPEDGRAWEALGALLAKEADRFREAEAALEKAISESGSRCSPRRQLGELYVRGEQPVQARASFEAALAVNPNCYCAAAGLEKLANTDAHFESVESLLRGILARRPESPRARYELARFLYRANRSLTESKTLLLQALKIGPNYRIYSLFADLVFEENDSVTGGNTEFLATIGSYPPKSDQLNHIAWELHRKYGSERSAVSVELARQAYQADPSWDVGHTLAFAYVDAGQIENALGLLAGLVNEHTERDLHHLVDLVVEIAKLEPPAATKVLEILRSDPQDKLEPLEVALRRRAGEDVHVAQEIYEVSNDILERMV